ncbi:MAG: 50S ribosome-binding GTPase [Granulosicoccus sp.]|nr:50S ribosome-binding GTPase [Granulosicoccus sp.]
MNNSTPSDVTETDFPAPDITHAQQNALKAWSRRAINAGWLSEHAHEIVDQATTARPDELFDHAHRPLVAGLFGGTGAGKSTLLNRLAGESIARASAQRPTSRNITLYVHHSISIDRLPDQLPVDRVHRAVHHNEFYRQIVFLDMPDFDSVETVNRELVDLWLPHVDVLLYVVSPERYRDHQGWRLLQQHAGEHAWIFIMNHWDKGSPDQLEDFKQQLLEAGMHDPVIFRTDCSKLLQESENDPDAINPASDDFEKLQTQLHELSRQSIIDSLSQLGVLARLKGLKALSDQWLVDIGRTNTLDELNQSWPDYWKAGSEKLSDALHWYFADHAARHAEPESFISRLLKKNRSESAEPVITDQLQQDVEQRLNNLVDEFINRSAQHHDLPITALNTALEHRCEQAQAEIGTQLRDCVVRAVRAPGNPLQRQFYRVLNALCLLLPLAAIAWVSWRVVAAFIDAGSNPAAYLGSNFAVNGALLVLFAWLIPAILHAYFSPTRDKAVLQGLDKGLSAAQNRIEGAVSAGLQELKKNAIDLNQDYQALWSKLADTSESDVPAPVRRLIVEQLNQPSGRSLDVRANTHASTDKAPLS